MTLQIGQFVRFNERGLGWATNRRGAPDRGQGVEWNGRVGQVGSISRDKTLVRVQWQGCKSLSDTCLPSLLRMQPELNLDSRRISEWRDIRDAVFRENWTRHIKIHANFQRIGP